MALLCAALFAVSPALAQQRAPAKPAPAPPPLKAGAIPPGDAPGARDAAVLPRYADGILLESKAAAFDEIALPNAALERRGDKVDAHNNDIYLPPAPLTVEGRVTRMSYLLPEGRSALEVVRGYQQVVKEGGGSVLYECSRDECGGSAVNSARSGGSKTGLLHMLYPYDMVAGPWTECVLQEGRSGQRYTLLDLGKGAGKAAVLVWNVGDVSAGSNCHAWVGRLVALVVTVEMAVREQRMETVKAAAVAQGLDRDGRVALYSILFDTAKAEIKPESQPQLTELAGYLKGAPGVRALIVGHTDNQGALDYNIDLSRRRADAVVKALAAQGVQAGRLVPQGVGMASPLATNETDDGRAKNRRVELVKQ
ncbi:MULTISPECIES: OmpA family protein [Methylobacterium]|uniref:OmpA family protein n=1 Tax=Methylobacterium TaxID=407 RepID=UPI000ED42E64|nr:MULTISPECIES: OmpA family protein [Methylobacterium]GBU18252.1 membrane protein [Methylobacterium sp.]